MPACLLGEGAPPQHCLEGRGPLEQGGGAGAQGWVDGLGYLALVGDHHLLRPRLNTMVWKSSCLYLKLYMVFKSIFVYISGRTFYLTLKNE